MEPQLQDVAAGGGGATGGGGGSDYTPNELKKARDWLAERKLSPYTPDQRRQLSSIAGLNRVDAGE